MVDQRVMLERRFQSLPLQNYLRYGCTP
uniref:Uncharacterized protein n=1 Tax=Anguilla anguilla TaxID=7936 RepID=A0A0E9SZC5_ANGAN